MATIAVAGLYNLETNLGVDGFPLPYFPVCYPFNRISQNHAGVGYNVSLALTRLGNQVRYATLIGDDTAGRQMQADLRQHGLSDAFVRSGLSATPQAVILVAPDGVRQIHCDLKDIQDSVYPAAEYDALLQGCNAVIACNINFARPLLAEAAGRGMLLATDVHVLSDFDGRLLQPRLYGGSRHSVPVTRKTAVSARTSHRRVAPTLPHPPHCSRAGRWRRPAGRGLAARHTPAGRAPATPHRQHHRCRRRTVLSFCGSVSAPGDGGDRAGAGAGLRRLEDRQQWSG